MELVQPGLANFMPPKFANNFRPTLRFFRSSYSPRVYSASTAFDTQLAPLPTKATKRGVVKGGNGTNNKAADALLKENWLTSLSCPFVEFKGLSGCCEDGEDVGLVEDRESGGIVIGIDPDLSGALAVLRTDASGCSAEVFDSPTVSILVGSRVRRRLDAHSIVKLLRSFGAPFGTKAYIEQSIPFPQDGKQGWWSGGFGYGLWIGVLVASGFSVIPVSSLLWKNEYELSGSRMCKDDSRKLASTLFPSVSSQLKRKKDHGRAEALLIAAYGNGFRIKSRVTQPGVLHPDIELLNPSDSSFAQTTEAGLVIESPEATNAAYV